MASKHGWKRPRTTAERRASEGVKVRPARNMANLPTYYDDRPIARQPRDDRYKSHRRNSNCTILGVAQS